MVGTLRRELLDRILIVTEVQPRWVLTEYLVPYNDHRPHRTLGSDRRTTRGSVPPPIDASVRRTQILGGQVNEYHTAA